MSDGKLLRQFMIGFFLGFCVEYFRTLIIEVRMDLNAKEAANTRQKFRFAGGTEWTFSEN